jgi:pyruvate dehydrogenase E1 component alpha subunit
VQVYAAVAPAIARARRGEGPSLIEVKTDRYFGHFQGDPESYRPKGEVSQLKLKDPIPKLAAQLRADHGLSLAQDAELVARAQARVSDAFEFARHSAYPAELDALHDVFVT